MLKLKAALVSLVLGSSSVALASPGVTFTAQAHGSFSFGPEIRDHRTQAPYGMPARTSWIQLSAPASLRGYAVIRPELARISQLRLQASRGMTYVSRVDVRFRDGSYQTLQVNRWLTVASSIDLSVRRGRVDSITLVGSANRNATYLLLANGSRIEQPQPPIYQPQPPIYQPQPPIYQPPVHASPSITLGENMTFVGTNGGKVMTVGSIKGAFNTLRIAGRGTGVFIKQVQIDFTDGSRQFASELNKSLGYDEHIDVTLDGATPRSVERVVVWTDVGYVNYGTLFAAALL